jgi:hypothetical protein
MKKKTDCFFCLFAHKMFKSPVFVYVAVRRTSSIAFTYYTAPEIVYPCKLYLLVASVQLTATEFVLDTVYQDGTSTAFSVSVNPFFGSSNTTCGDVLECTAVPIAYFSGTTFANLGNLYIISFALNRKILTEIRILTFGAPDLAIFGMTGVYPEPGSPETLPPVTPPTGGAPTPGLSPAGNPNPPPASAPTPGPSPAGNPNPSPNSAPTPGPSPAGPNVPPGPPEAAPTPDTTSPSADFVPTSSGAPAAAGAPQSSPKAPTTAPTPVGCPATQPTFPSGYSLSCVGSQWVIVGNVVISSTTSPISTFSVPPNTATPTVVVSGCVNITSNTVAELLLDPDTANKIANKTLQQIVLIQSQASCLTGRFDSVTVKCSDGSNTASCTSSCVGTEQQSSPQSLTVLFSSSCSNLDAGLPLSLPWWGILIIVVGIIAVIVAVLVLSAIFSKKFRRAVFPFLERRKHMQNQAGENDL